ncbi:MAG: hypothetical protein JOZ18_15215 [Chloroflexi bacterium]|nr:hypothetical protein [Chloroflexota bacterium]
MIALKRPFLAAIGLLALIILSSCGGSTSSGAPTSSAPTTAPTTAAYPTSAPTTAPTTAAAASAAIVKTASATVGGKSLTILTDAKGMTLYYFDPDTTAKTVCTGSCAQNWPPLLFTGTDKPTAEGTLPGSLDVSKNDNGNQVVYNDHPLYTFVGDTAAGQITGDGKAGGKWHVATPDIPKNK